MNERTIKKLSKKKEKLQKELEKNLLLSSEGFKPSDIIIGVVVGFVVAGFFLWIPVLGWIMAPIIIIISPFMGTTIRKNEAKKKLKKIREELRDISFLLAS